MNLNNYYEIPLTIDPNQNFNVTIPVDGRNLKLNLNIRYNTQGNYWWMTINQNGATLLDGIPLVVSDYPAADILEQYRYLGLGSAFVLNISQVQGDNPDNTNLGVDYLLIWGDTVE